MYEENKKLIEKYPFLLPRNVWTDKVDETYDYSWTRLDEVPEGWRTIFLDMCEKLKQALIDVNYLDKFRFSQIKEKYGSLRLYNFGAPEKAYDIIRKCEILSAHTCINCGSSATKKSCGYILPYCDKCAEELIDSGIFFDNIENF